MTINENTIAIIGLSGRFPGADSLEEFWSNLVQGKESLSRFDREESLAAGNDPKMVDDPNYVPVRGVLKDIEKFDAPFFSMTPREAEITDPQQRLMLECAWEALEDSGYAPATYNGFIGVFTGSSMNTYMIHNILANGDLMDRLGAMQVVIGNEKDHMAMRLAYKLNLRGPAITIQTACSTSLVAVHMACQSLLSGETDMALAGGVSINVPQYTGHVYAPNGIGSPDGHCRAFDIHSGGTVAGNGAGVVVLKRAAEALEDGDQIYALIQGSAVNNDGSGKVGYTAPGMVGQAQVVATAQQVAGVTPDMISYIEAHGTGTELGDPIEVSALTEAFRALGWKQNRVLLGSIKPSIGHLDAASGVAGLIKCALALKNEQIPATINFTAPNPQIHFEQTPFDVVSKLTPWPRGARRRICGVSSFGIGGTNAHVILEEAPLESKQTQSSSAPEVITLSARTETALKSMAQNLSAYVKAHPELPLGAIAYTLRNGRTDFAYRRTVVCSSTEEFSSKIASSTHTINGKKQDFLAPVFMFPGQGSQSVGMAKDLYEEYEVFRNIVDTSCAFLAPKLDVDLKALLLGTVQGAEADRQLTETQISQLAIFIVEYGLATLLSEWGIEPALLIGHSVGEYTAAVVAGALTLEEGLALIAERGRLMALAPRGAMLAVFASEEEIQDLLPSELVISAKNGPRVNVVAGAGEVIEQFAAQLQENGIKSHRLDVSHAFHSPSMDEVKPLLQKFAETIAFKPLQKQILSNVTGQYLERGKVLEAHYWAEHLRQPVLFRQGLEKLTAVQNPVLIEVGPGTALTSLIRRSTFNSTLKSIPLMTKDKSPRDSLLEAIGELWTCGYEVAWNLDSEEQPQRISLPTYPFERKRYWIDAPKVSRSQATFAAETDSHEQEKQESEVISMLGSGEIESDEALVYEVAKEIADIWKDLLGVEDVDHDSNFFDLGGHSLLALQLLARVREAYSVELTVRVVFDHPSLLSISQVILDAMIEGVEAAAAQEEEL